MSVWEEEYISFVTSSDSKRVLTGNVYNTIVSSNIHIFFYVEFVELHEQYDCYICEHISTHNHIFKATSVVNNKKCIIGTIKRGQTNFSEITFNLFSTQIECDSIQNTLELKIIPHLFTYLE